MTEENGQTAPTMTAGEYLMLGEFPEIRKMKKEKLQAELLMWRRLWQWTPEEVRFYVARVNTMIALTMRNYKRQIGILAGTRWIIESIEIKTTEKVHDYRDGQEYFENKTMIVKVGGVQNVSFIHDRMTIAEIEKKYGQPVPPLPKTP